MKILEFEPWQFCLLVLLNLICFWLVRNWMYQKEKVENAEKQFDLEERTDDAKKIS